MATYKAGRDNNVTQIHSVGGSLHLGDSLTFNGGSFNFNTNESEPDDDSETNSAVESEEESEEEEQSQPRRQQTTRQESNREGINRERNEPSRAESEHERNQQRRAENERGRNDNFPNSAEREDNNLNAVGSGAKTSEETSSMVNTSRNAAEEYLVEESLDSAREGVALGVNELASDGEEASASERSQEALVVNETRNDEGSEVRVVERCEQREDLSLSNQNQSFFSIVAELRDGPLSRLSINCTSTYAMVGIGVIGILALFAKKYYFN